MAVIDSLTWTIPNPAPAPAPPAPAPAPAPAPTSNPPKPILERVVEIISFLTTLPLFSVGRTLLLTIDSLL